MNRPDWNEYFLLIAKAVAARGECTRAQVGAVLVKDKRIVATGYNGVAAGERSCLDGACPRGLSGVARRHEGGPETPCIALHAEENAINDAYNRGLYDDVFGSTIYLTKEPCPRCQTLLKTFHLTVVWWDETRQTGSLPRLPQVP